MKKNNKFSIKDRIRSFKYAFEGILYFARNVQNGWIHCLVTVIVIVLAISFKISLVEWLWITQAIFIVFIAEFINTAIEKNVDLVTEEHHEKAKRAKDLAAGAVLLAAIYAVIIGIVIFFPYFNMAVTC